MGRERAWISPAITIASAAAITAVLLSLATGYPGRLSGRTSLASALAIVALTALVRFLRFFFEMWRSGEQHPASRIRSELGPALISFAPIVAGIAILGIFLSSITFLKSMIPALVPFWADSAFAATDRAMFIDQEAIALALSPVLDLIGLFYGLWHFVHLGSILWVLHWRRDAKARHILSFMLTWSIGMFFAYLFSSMGPIFTGQFDPSVAPAITRKAAAFLSANYQMAGAQIGGGISAFPSMHVAMAAWLAIVLKDRGWPKLGVAYLLAIFACSIILGWHYAVDGVAGAAIALLADRLAMAWLKQRDSRLATIPQPACAVTRA